MRVVIQANAKTEKLLDASGRFLAGVSAALAEAMEEQVALTIEHISEVRMNGKGPFPVHQRKLGVVDGVLRQSLRAVPSQASKGTIRGGISSHVEYAAAHEFGFEGDVAVKAHTRAVTSLVTGGRRKGQRRKVGEARVRKHTRHMVIPKRAPIAAGFEDRADEIKQAFRDAISSVLTNRRNQT